MTGVARGKYLQSVSGVNVQLRNLNTGELAGVTVTTDAGTFTFRIGVLPEDRPARPLDGVVNVRNLGDKAGAQFKIEVEGLEPTTATHHFVKEAEACCLDQAGFFPNSIYS